MYGSILSTTFDAEIRPCINYQKYNEALLGVKIFSASRKCFPSSCLGKQGLRYYLRITFEGENFREFRGFVAIRESFLREIWGCVVLWRGTSEQSAKVFSTKIVFFTNSRKFSPSKVSRCTVRPCIYFSNPTFAI